jgi:acetyltransferase-like isoleucine patch superfamily enzyme
MDSGLIMERVMTNHTGRPPEHCVKPAFPGPVRSRFNRRWRRFWLRRAGMRGFGRLAAWLASRHAAPFHQTAYLADLSPRGFVAAGARVTHPDARFGRHVYLGDRVIIYSTNQGGPVELADRVQLYGNTFVETGMGGRVSIGEGTHIQPGCHIHAFLSEISIGKKVEIAPGCAFYCYDHGMVPGVPIMEQPLSSRGGIFVGDGAWLGHGVTVLQGVAIGPGAVVAAGSVVIRDIPANAIAGGVPARILKFRDGSAPAMK